MRKPALPDDPDRRIVATFARAVPEIASGAVRIRALARIPGVRTRIAVETDDPLIDPVSACVGWRGNRVKGVVAELDGERVDIVPWSSSPKRCIKLALAPLRAVSMALDEETRRALVVVTYDFGHWNAAPPSLEQWQELATRISGWNVELMLDPDSSA